MMKNTLLICLLISQLHIAACAKKKEVTVEQSCTQQISQAEQLQQEKAGTLDDRLNATITNLISAAKIHSQHSQYVLCIDKVERALTLLENRTAATQQQN